MAVVKSLAGCVVVAVVWCPTLDYRPPRNVGPEPAGNESHHPTSEAASSSRQQVGASSSSSRLASAASSANKVLARLAANRATA